MKVLIAIFILFSVPIYAQIPIRFGTGAIAAPAVSQFNPSYINSTMTLSAGNTTLDWNVTPVVQGSGFFVNTHTSGLWYFELTINTVTGAISKYYIGGGIAIAAVKNVNTLIGSSGSGSNHDYAYGQDEGSSYKWTNGSPTAFGVTVAQGDVMMYAVDLTNGFIYVGKNGVWMNSGVPTSGTGGTGAMYTIDLNGVYWAGAVMILYSGASNLQLTSTATYTMPSGYSIW